MFNSDIVSYFKQLVNGLYGYAEEQQVKLSFDNSIQSFHLNSNQDYINQQLTKFLCKIIDFTPQNSSVTVSLEAYNYESELLILSVANTGIDLSRLTEATTMMNYKCFIERIDNVGTKFNFQIPLKLNHNSKLKALNLDKTVNLRYTPYYLEIGKRLTTHFSNIENLEKLAEQKVVKEGAFLKRVNLILKTYMHDNRFNVEMLSKAMSLSRTQLYRKLKALTEMSPIQYILFTRLLIAKDLLEDNRNDLNISEVSFKVGFISNSHFSRAFKKQFGVNPSIILQK